MNVYFISGLGADRRAFERIQLPPQYYVHYLDWIEPAKNESLNDYALRLGQSIDTSTPFAIVGLSMGGMVAAVLSKKLHPQKTVLISSIGCTKEFPLLLKFAAKTGAHKILPGFIFRPRSLFFVQRVLGTKLKGQKALLWSFISQSNPAFIRWAINAIINWENRERPANIYHIHGSSDKMFPLKYTRPDIVIKNGSHFMVWTKAGEVSKVLQEVLDRN
jgi:pimeloyl-ACP methyl ester carboxylesterase